MKDLSERRILIVDDVKANVDVLVQALRDDYKLSMALNGEAALRSVGKGLPDLLLLDIVMPGIDGYEVYAHNPRGMFVTLFCCVIDTVKMTICCANAGHPSPVLLRSDAEPSFPFYSTSAPIGVFEAVEVEARLVDLHARDGMVIYTDGVTEAFNASGIMFADEGLISSFQAVADRSAAALAACLRNAVRQHVGNHPQSDDLTILALACP